MNGVQLARNYCSATVPRKTFSNQEKLPPLPVPSLKDTLDKFLRTAAPVAESTLGNPDLFRKTEELAQDLLRPGGVGEHLQKKLEERGKTHKNWLEDWWLSQAYLAWPDPIPIYSNYYFLFDEELKGTSQTLTAAKYISGIIQYKKALDAEQIPPEYMQKTTPMCMHQYTKLFTTARIPGEKEDTAVQFKPSQHVVVISNKQHFVLDVFNGQQALTTQEIEAQLSKILAESKKQIPKLGLGVLTGVARPVWAQAREHMIKLDNSNKAGFEAIERALAVIVLDPATPSTAEEAGRLALGGDASQRWFDKLSEVIVFANGRGGFSGEHSPLDAIATASLSGYMLSSAKHDNATVSSSQNIGQNLPSPKKINWVMDKEVTDKVEKAAKDYNAYFEDHDYALLYFKNYGSNWIKEVAKVSPDSYAQMAIQLAYFKLHNKGVGTYETAQTRQYYHGRTETCRSFSKESLEWTKAMSSKDISNETKLNLLKKAIDSHKKYMSDAVAGKGIDRHLLGLRLIAAEEKIQLPPLFSDPVYKASCNWRLSTSNITQNGMVAGYGPAVEDGYGVCYGTRKDLLHFSVSTRVSNKSTSTPKMRDALVQSLNEMQALFSGQNPTAKL